MQKNADRDHENLPVCQLGPGGSFIQGWPDPANENPRYAATGIYGQLGYVIASLALSVNRLVSSISGKAVGSMLPEGAQDRKTLPQKMAYRTVNYWRMTNDPSQVQKEPKLLHCYRESLTCPDAPAGSDTKTHPSVSQQQWLFPDAARTGRNTATQQSHRIRTRAGSRPKTHPASYAKQGSLFDD